MKQVNIVATELSYCNEVDEYTVKAYRLAENGNIVRYAACDYFTDDKQDAVDTARAMRETQIVPESYGEMIK